MEQGDKNAASSRGNAGGSGSPTREEPHTATPRTGGSGRGGGLDTSGGGAPKEESYVLMSFSLKSISRWILCVALFVLVMFILYVFTRSKHTHNEWSQSLNEYRVDSKNAMLGGVASGMARESMLPIFAWRLIWVASMFVFPISVVAIGYFVYWAVGSAPQTPPPGISFGSASTSNPTSAQATTATAAAPGTSKY